MSTTTAATTELMPVEALEMRTISETSGKQDILSNPTESPPGDVNEPSPEKGLDRATYLKLISAGFSFIVSGCNDGSVGALIPYMIREYNISTALVSVVYAATFSGWVLAALVNTHLCTYLDLGAVLSLGAVIQAVAFALRFWNPPFGLFVTSFLFASVGQAFQDTQCNTFAASLKGAHRWLAFIHAMYAMGCLIAPFVATAIASAGGEEEDSRWYVYYAFPLGLSVINIALCMYAFRDTFALKRQGVATGSSPPTDGAIERQPYVTRTSGQGDNIDREVDVSRNGGAVRQMRDTYTSPSVWLLCTFFFFYIGAVLTAGGWIVEYLVAERDGKLSTMGYVPAGFNGGTLLGRLLLAEPTHRYGSRKMLTIYIALSIALQLLFWFKEILKRWNSVPNIIAASIAISLVGFFLGPLFAAGMTLGFKLFPSRIHSTALALVFLCAQMGGSVFPVLTGVIAASAGVQVLQPILVALLVLTGISWIAVSRPKLVASGTLHQE